MKSSASQLICSLCSPPRSWTWKLSHRKFPQRRFRRFLFWKRGRWFQFQSSNQFSHFPTVKNMANVSIWTTVFKRFRTWKKSTRRCVPSWDSTFYASNPPTFSSRFNGGLEGIISPLLAACVYTTWIYKCTGCQWVAWKLFDSWQYLTLKQMYVHTWTCTYLTWTILYT